MKIRFDGVPGEDDRESVTMYGQEFPKGKYVEVEGYQAQTKLSRHPHFTVKDGDEVDAKPIVKLELPQTIPLSENATVVVTSGEAAKVQPTESTKKAHR